MATLSSVIETLKEINENQEASSDRRSDELKSVFTESIKELAKSIESSRGLGFRLPRLPSISNIITNNPIAKAIGSIRDTITNAITAPYKLLTGAISGITSTFSKAFSALGSIISTPFKLLKNLIFPTGSGTDRESIKVLKEINLGILGLNTTLESYIDYLKNKELDDLEARRERDDIPPGRNDPGDNIPPVPPAPPGNNSIFALPPIKLLMGLAGSVLIEALNLDDFVKALMLPDLFKSVKGVFTKITGFFSPLVNFFEKIKLPDFPNLGISDKIGKFFKGITNFLSPLASIFKPMTGLIGSASKLLKVIPGLNIFLTIFDGLFGAIKGFMETEGSLKDKLWGALEGGIMGIVTGITKAIDLIAVTIPAWILEKLGFEGAAEKLRTVSITDMVVNLWENIKGLFSSGIEGFTTTLKNIPDYLYMAAQKYLKISIPEISIGLPEWLGGGKFTLVPAFSVGFGSTQGAAQAEQNIIRRNEELIQRRRTQDREANSVLEQSQTRLNEASDRVNSSRIAAIQNNVDARQTQNNTTVMNQGAFPLPVDVRDPVRGPI